MESSDAEAIRIAYTIAALIAIRLVSIVRRILNHHSDIDGARGRQLLLPGRGLLPQEGKIRVYPNVGCDREVLRGKDFFGPSIPAIPYKAPLPPNDDPWAFAYTDSTRMVAGVPPSWLDDHTVDTSPDLPLPPGHGFYYGVFTPDVFPHERYIACCKYDNSAGKWILPRAQPETFATIDSRTAVEQAAIAGKCGATHRFYIGRYVLGLAGGRWHPLPAAGADMEILDFRVINARGRRFQVALEFGRDEAGNCYVRTTTEIPFEPFEIRYYVAVPRRYFGYSLPVGIPFAYPGSIPEEVRQAMTMIGLAGQESDFRHVLSTLIRYFRGFGILDAGISRTHASPYLDVVSSRAGVCRHRAFAFARTAVGIGMHTRYVLSSEHVYAEVEVPHVGWVRVDLGGAENPFSPHLSTGYDQEEEEAPSDDFSPDLEEP